MKNSEIRELTTKELIEKIDEDKIFMSRQKMNHAVSPLENPMKMRVLRKDLAKLKTELRSRQLNENVKK
ncbi:MAG: 50S ribosomal protein L29 [Bacteroidia bacterium]|nr:50S ribosomal protein L29 [Bacteroidia bacterium]